MNTETVNPKIEQAAPAPKKTDNAPVLECRGVSVTYTIRRRYGGGIKDSFLHGGRNLLRRLMGKPLPQKDQTAPFHALQDISFAVYPGEVIGLIGRNGSGKSTLLRHLAGIEYPDAGEVKVCGKVGSLLSLSAGFRGNLTGLENIYLRGAILGLSRKAVERMIPQILDFCEIGDFIFAPLRIYSSGMKARLGFAISTVIDPDILLLDEVIGVGDELFRRKAGNIFSLMKRENQHKVIVLATHSLDMVEKYCNKVLWLENGKIQKWGEVGDVIRDYTQWVDRRSEAKKSG